MPLQEDQKYFNIVIEPLQVCMKYKPKLGHGGKDGYSLKEFRSIAMILSTNGWAWIPRLCMPPIKRLVE